MPGLDHSKVITGRGSGSRTDLPVMRGIGVQSRSPHFRFERVVHAFSGAKAARVVHSASNSIKPHRHDWVCLTLPVLGAVTEEYEHEAVTVNGPAVVLHPAGHFHANEIHKLGLDCLSIRFDPAWLSRFGFDLTLKRSVVWQGSEIPRRGRHLFASWARNEMTERDLAGATANFIDFAINQPPLQQPSWMKFVVDKMRELEPPSTAALAKELGLHPAWLARAYKQHKGEGLASTRCRGRMEVAAALLRESEERLSEIAVAAGFCDQSHMTRVCLAFTGKTPLQLRRDVQAFR